MISRIRALSCLALLAGGVLFADDPKDAPKADGWVLSVTGDWTRTDKDGRREVLQQFSGLFVNDKLQATTKGSLEVSLKDGQSPHKYPCDQPPCVFNIPGFRPAQESVLARLGRAFGELAAHRDTMPVSAISRGSVELHQAVVAFNNGRLDLKDAVGAIDTSTYAVYLRPIAVAPVDARSADGRLRGLLRWDPPDGTFASFPSLAPGVYVLTLSSSEGDTLGNVAVLVSSPADYQARRKAFAAAVQALPQDLDPIARDVFLNVLLFDIGFSQK